MRILTIVSGLGPGGTERSAQNSSIAYTRRGHDVALLAYREGGPRLENFGRPGIPVFVGGPNAPDLDRAIDEAIGWRPEIIHIHRKGRPDAATADILRRLRSGAPTRLPVLETNHFSRVDDSPDRALIDVHMQLSRWCMWKWRQWARGLRPPPLGAIVPHIIDGDSFHPADQHTRRAFRSARGIPEDSFVFGRLGQPYHSKWSAVAFRAFAEVAERHPQVWLLLVGLPRSHQPSIDRMPPAVRRRVIQIDFLHGDDEIRAGYASLDVFLHSSLIGESFGMVLAESMLCGRPVITMSTPAHDNSQLEVVGHERGGLVVHDRSGMVTAMERLLRDPALRERLGRQGREWCLEQYDADRVAAIMLRIAELALAEPTRESLAAALDADPLVETSVSWDELRRLLSNAIGAPSRRELALMRLVHRPIVYKGIRLFRRLRPPT